MPWGTALKGGPDLEGSRFELISVPARDSQSGGDQLHTVALLDRLRPDLPPFSIHFERPQVQARLRKSELKRELLIRATGLLENIDQRSNSLMSVWDTTAGLGVESVLMAAAGAKVIGFEREPLLTALAQNALERWLCSVPSELELKFIGEEFTADPVQIKNWISKHGEPAVLYFDPMFFSEAIETKSLPKKGMQVLREITRAETADAFLVRLNASVEALVRLVSENKSVRFVVKQPRSSDKQQSRLFRVEQLAPRLPNRKFRRYWVTGKLVQFEILRVDPVES